MIQFTIIHIQSCDSTLDCFIEGTESLIFWKEGVLRD